MSLHVDESTCRRETAEQQLNIINGMAAEQQLIDIIIRDVMTAEPQLINIIKTDV